MERIPSSESAAQSAPREPTEAFMRIYPIALKAGICAGILAAGWVIMALVYLDLYFFKHRGPGDLYIFVPAIYAVGIFDLLMGLAGIYLKMRRGLEERIMKRARLSIIAGLVCLMFASGCAPCRWPAREEVGKDVKLPVVYNSGYNIDIRGASFVSIFDTYRYKKIYKALVRAGITSRRSVVVPREVTDEELLLVHTKQWIEKTRDPYEVGMALTPVVSKLPRGFVRDWIVAPFRIQTRGTVLAARYALERGAACTLGGGFAHAMSDEGQGFNLFADVPLAIAELRRSGWKGKVMILDVDVHHGQGNASFFKDDPTVFILDVYNPGIYPGVRKAVGVSLPVEVPSGTGDKEYLEKLGAALPGALDGFHPDLVIYVAGVDASEKDELGELKLTEEGLFQRDKLVIDACFERKLPLCMTLSGGYWKGSWRPSARMIEYAASRMK